MLHTVHGAIGVAELDFYNSLPGDVGLVALSESQRRQAPDLGWIGVVHNAVDVRHLAVAHPDLDPRYLLCLARICEDKGQHVAIAVARRCGLRIVLAGKVEETPQGREYFRRKVEPYIDGTNVIYMPSVTAAAKARLIARATAMLAPVSWPEPFGLSIVEAMVSGTPAISLRQGAAAELIEEGVTGFVVDDEDNMVAAVGRAGEIDAIECARVARERFTPEVMTNGYVRVYRHALDRLMGPTDDQATGNLPVNGGGFVGPRDRLPEMVPVYPDFGAGGSWPSSLARGYQQVGLRPAPWFCSMKPSTIASIGGLVADSTTRSWTIAPAQREAMPVRNSTVSSVVAEPLEESAPTRV